MNGWPTTPCPPQKLEVMLRGDGTFLDWRCARVSTFALWGFQTGKSMRHSTMWRFTPPGNDAPRTNRQVCVRTFPERNVGRERMPPQRQILILANFSVLG